MMRCCLWRVSCTTKSIISKQLLASAADGLKAFRKFSQRNIGNWTQTTSMCMTSRVSVVVHVVWRPYFRCNMHILVVWLYSVANSDGAGARVCAIISRRGTECSRVHVKWSSSSWSLQSARARRVRLFLHSHCVGGWTVLSSVHAHICRALEFF